MTRLDKLFLLLFSFVLLIVCITTISIYSEKNASVPLSNSIPYFKEKRYRFQDGAIGDTLRHTFFLYNKGEETVKILDANCSCECVQIDIHQYSIAPQAKAEVVLSYVPGYMGFFSKAVKLSTDSKYQPLLYLQIDGLIEH